MSDFKPLVYEWDHARNRYVTPGDRVECLKERVVAADDYVTMKEELRAEVDQLRLNMLKCGCHHPGYIIGIHWLAAAYGRICAGESEAEVMADYGYGRLPDPTTAP